jgi:hypothetical protein
MLIHLSVIAVHNLGAADGLKAFLPADRYREHPKEIHVSTLQLMP